MKYKTLFRLLLKVVGVLIFATALSGFFTYVAYIFESLSSRSGGNVFYPQFIYNLIGPGMQMAFGAYLFFGGRWIADKAIPGNRNYCHECGYDLTGATTQVCTECGTPFRAEIQPGEPTHER